jgi:hypothetical protein
LGASQVVSTNGGGGAGNGSQSSSSPQNIYQQPQNGGSGGGCGRYANVSVVQAISITTSPGGFGNAGGWPNAQVNRGSGGGGAAAAGGVGINNSAIGLGGAGFSTSISGSLQTYGTGGNGGNYQIGGAGANGAANTGNGGAGADGAATPTSGGNGGSGIVIIRYPVSAPLTGTTLFSQLSSAAVATAVGAFSLRAVNGTTTKAVRIIRQSDLAQQDFWADRLGNLLTAPVTGQTLASWLGGATGNVATWYDQSNAGNHMSCSSTGIQPKIDLANNFIDFKTSAYFDVSAGSTGPVPFQSSKNYTVVFRHGQFIGSGLFCATQNAAGPYGNLVNNFKKGTGATYTQYWYGNDVINKGVLTTGNRVSYKWDGTNRSLYVNGSLADATASSGWAQTSSAIQMIGKTNFDATMNGELYGVFMFTTALSDSDRTLLENFL